MEPNGAAPVAGDIIVHKRHASGDLYALGVFKRAPQLTCQAHEEAVKRATEFAVKDGVDVWYTEDGKTYRTLARHRRRQHGEKPTES